MKAKFEYSLAKKPAPGKEQAFTMLEVIVGMAIVGIVFVSLYSGITFGVQTVRLARESLQATQLIQSKMEVARIYSWSQVTSNNFIPTTFQQTFYAAGQTNGGLTYSGTVAVTDVPITESYANSLKKVTVSVTWQSGSMQRQRQMSTLISQYGMQNYIY